MKHHPQFSPSAAERWLSCTASAVQLAKGPRWRDPGSIYAAEGTLAHQVLDHALTHGGRLPEWFGEERLVDGHTVRYTSEMREAVQWSLDIIYGLGAGVLLSEQRVSFPVTEEVTIFGTSDAVLVPDATPGDLHVLDLKYGKGVQVFANHPQLKLYGRSTVHEFVPMLFDSIQRVHLHILQPRLDHHDIHVMHIEELLAWCDEEVKPAVVEVTTTPGTYRPSEEACRWCPIGMAGECEAQTREVLSHFDVLDEPDDGHVEPQLLALADLSEVLKRGAWLTRMLDALKARAERVLIEAGGTCEDLPDWKMVNGRGGNRVWRDEEVAMEGLPYYVDEIYQPRKLRSPADVEKELGKKPFAASALADFVHKPKGRPTLAPIDDKRAAWAPDTDSDLFDLEEEPTP